MEVAVTDLAGLTRAAVAAHQRLWTSASRMTDEDCRAPSLLPGWSRSHVLAHWARNADGQTRIVDLMLPRVLPTLDARLIDETTVQVQAPGLHWAHAGTAAVTADEPVVVRGAASAVLCWLAGRPVPRADLTVSRSGQPWRLPRLRPWA